MSVRTSPGWVLVLAALGLGVAMPMPAETVASAGSGGPLLAVSVSARVITGDRDAAGERLSGWAEANGGYFTYHSLDRVVLRIPDHALADLRDAMTESGDELLAYHPAATDLSAELRDVEAAIAARREALDRILEYLSDSGVSATLAFERELRSLNQEIEGFVGRRRAIVNDAAYARVEISLTALRRSIPERVPSSFAWINTVDLYRFVDEMYGGSR